MKKQEFTYRANNFPTYQYLYFAQISSLFIVLTVNNVNTFFYHARPICCSVLAHYYVPMHANKAKKMFIKPVVDQKM